jgi:hypothetical protein
MQQRQRRSTVSLLRDRIRRHSIINIDVMVEGALGVWEGALEGACHLTEVPIQVLNKQVSDFRTGVLLADSICVFSKPWGRTATHTSASRQITRL